MFNLFPFGFLASLFSGAQDKNYRLAVEQTYDLVIVNRDIAPDGFNRSAVLAGGTFPGPTISGEKGDTFVINVINDLTDTSMDVVTSVHWHGIDQYSFNAQDGVAFVTQCPIIPGNAFQYKFTVPTQTGTYWYHSHYANQYCDGLRGAFVIRDPEDPQAGLYDVDDDSTVITLADWYHFPSTSALHNAHFVQSGPTTLINGLGRDSSGSTTPLAIVNIEHGKRYRFRLVSTSCQPNWKFSIDNHEMTIIEVDGTNAQPLVVDQIQIFAGQRYSFVLNANQSIDNYWIRALPNAHNATTDNGVNAAILHYIGANLSDPTSQDTSGKSPLVETDLHPYVASPVPNPPKIREITLNVTFDGPNSQYCVNDVSFENPAVPVLLQILSGTTTVGDLLPKGSIYGLNRDDVVELTIPGGAQDGPHPVHLHGHSFYVVRSAGNSSYNYENPIIRDVVSIGDSTDSVTIRFVADNPGPWFFHCHIDFHLASGFAVVFVEDILDVPSSEAPPAAWSQLCPAYSSYSPTSAATRTACPTSTAKI